MYKVKFKNKYLDGLTFLSNDIHLSFEDELTNNTLKFCSFRQAYNFVEFIVGYSRFLWKDFEIV